MNAQTVVSILSMLLAAEPAVVAAVHDLLVGSGGQSDQAVLTADAVDWAAIVTKAKAALAPATPPV